MTEKDISRIRALWAKQYCARLLDASKDTVYRAQSDAPEKADYVLEQIEKAFSSLSESPERGTYPMELSALGIREYREILFKPYRIISRVADRNVYVMLIVDGRRGKTLP